MKKPLKQLYWASLTFAALGLAGGLFFREYTKAHDFTGFTELAVVHTHLLMLGMFGLLIVLGLEKIFTLSKTKWFNLFFWHYCGGLALTAAMMFVIGIRQVNSQDISAMFAGIAGLGHIILTVSIIFLFTAIYKRLNTAQSES